MESTVGLHVRDNDWFPWVIPIVYSHRSTVFSGFEVLCVFVSDVRITGFPYQEPETQISRTPRLSTQTFLERGRGGTCRESSRRVFLLSGGRSRSLRLKRVPVHRRRPTFRDPPTFLHDGRSVSGPFRGLCFLNPRSPDRRGLRWTPVVPWANVQVCERLGRGVERSVRQTVDICLTGPTERPWFS